TLADAGARGDPLVAGVDDLRQVVVGQHLAGKVAAGTGDTGIDPRAAAHLGDGPPVETSGPRRGLPRGADAVRAEVTRPACGPGSGSIFLDSLRLRLDHLLATVVAVGGDVVAQVGLARGRVGSQLLGRERVVRTTHATTGR